MSVIGTALAVLPTMAVDRIKKLGALTIRSVDQEKDAIDGRAWVKGLRAQLDKARKTRVDPLNAQVEEINAEYRPALQAIKTAADAITAAILDWGRRERERIAEEQRRVREENERRERVARAETELLQREAREREAAERRRVEEETRKAAEQAGFKPEEAQELAQLEAADVKPESVAVVAEPVRLVAPSAPLPTRRTETASATVRKIVDRDAIQRAVDAGVREIPGVRIWPVWQFEVIASADVPETYRKESLAGSRT